MLLLGAALLAGSAAAAVDQQRATRTLAGRSMVDAESRRAVGEVLQGWDARADSLPVGARMDIDLRPAEAGGIPRATRAALSRLSPSLYVAGVVVVVGTADHAIARRELQVLVRRAAGADDGGAADTSVRSGSARVIARWHLVEPR